MALGSTQPLAEMSTRNLPGGKGRPARKADNSPPSVSRLSSENVGASTSHNPVGVCYRDTFTFFFSGTDARCLFTVSEAGYEKAEWSLLQNTNQNSLIMLLKESAPGSLICNLNMLLVTAEESAVMQLCHIGASIMPRNGRLAQHFHYSNGLYQRLIDYSPWLMTRWPKNSSDSSIEKFAVFASLHVTVYWTVHSLMLHTTNRTLGWPHHSSSG
jgi:hypothetical protein